MVDHELIDDGEVVLARLSGELDLSNVPALTEQLREAVPPERAGLCLDLSGVRYIDSTGIRMLFALARELEVRRQRLALALPEDSQLMRILAITEVAQAATIHPVSDDCIADLRSGAPGKPK